MSNSKLVTVTQISPNKNSPRNHAIDRITIHCFVGQVTAKRGCEVFQPTSKQASCNYVAVSYTHLNFGRPTCLKQGLP